MGVRSHRMGSKVVTELEGDPFTWPGFHRTGARFLAYPAVPESPVTLMCVTTRRGNGVGGLLF